MKFRMVHNNLNVFDLEKSLKFYADAFDMHEVRRIRHKVGKAGAVRIPFGSNPEHFRQGWPLPGKGFAFPFVQKGPGELVLLHAASLIEVYFYI